MSALKKITAKLYAWIIALRLRWLLSSIEDRMKVLKGLVTAKAE